MRLRSLALVLTCLASPLAAAGPAAARTGSTRPARAVTGDLRPGAPLRPGPAAAPPGERLVIVAAPLVDLDPAAPDPTDGAGAVVFVTVTARQTRVLLAVDGFAPDLAGRVFGAHVHTGPCVAGEPAAAGPHYRDGDGPPSPRSEIWLDIGPGRRGPAVRAAVVPFAVPSGGARSIVIHAEPTRPDGAAGSRLACLPLGV